MLPITIETLRFGTGASLSDAEKYLDVLNETMEKYSIDTPVRVAAFLATLAVESQNLSKVQEGLYYKDPERLAKMFRRAFDTDHDGAISAEEVAHAEQFCRNPAAVDEYVYAGCAGKGLLQLTWEKNYRLCGDALGFDYVANPKLLLEPWHAAMSAGWYWDTNHINSFAEDPKKVRKAVNGPALEGLSVYTEHFNRNLSEFS